MIERLTSALDFQAKALVLRAERQRLIASNIANADTPGYVSRDFDFAQALRSATAGSPAPGGGADSNALGAPIAGDLLADSPAGDAAAPRLQYATPSQTNLDRNTVDMDRERAAFADNALKYESTLTFINSGVRWMVDAMKSPSQG
ncbi:MAG: flagellar basal-body rod protein FlgB [Rubrivivax sp. SCN 70-15]|jgi:flagellar basal-body rod protein FlgB|nr:MAG: flagellar basal-body rod protein FlgB [Rubrivivax sp. SCN 70-15]